MSAIRTGVAAALLVTAIAAGTMADVSRGRPVRVLDGYHVLASDFHVHTFPFGWSLLSPWDVVIEARRQGLDVIAMTPHNNVQLAKLAQWVGRRTGGPLVIVGEEITARKYHMVAVGIRERVSNRLSAAEAIDDVHRQGGVAIAAHPYENTWDAWDAAARQRLDAAEIVRPEAQHVERLASQLREFFGRGSFTAIGSSDYHGLAQVGYCRTYVFARTPTEEGVLEALRHGRTVVYDRDRVYGDPAMIQIAAAHGGLPHEIPEWPVPGAAQGFSRIAGLIALVAFVLFNPWGRRPSRPATNSPLPPSKQAP